MFGYTFYETGEEAREAYASTPTVRYAAELSDGRGITAWDDVGPAGGTPYEATLFWWWRAAPKRAVTNGLERFAIVSEDHARNTLRGAPQIVGMAKIGDGAVLVESQDWDVPLALWQASAVAVEDRRLVSA